MPRKTASTVAAGAALLTLAACGQPQSEGASGEAAPAAETASAGPFNGPEAAVYDAAGDRYFVSNVGARDDAEDGFILALDGETAPTNPHWAPQPGDPPAANPLGVDIGGGVLYVADTPYVRRYDLATGAALPAIEIPGARLLNDVAVGVDGTVYVTDSGTTASATWAVRQIAKDGHVGVLAAGRDLRRPNGVDVGLDGAIYVAAMTEPVVVKYAINGFPLGTVPAPHAGNDGIVVMHDGGIILSSVVDGKVSHIAPDGTSRLIAEGLPGAASITYDPSRKRIAVPRVAANTVDFLTLE
jgi:sugar lactone lactonase YvrE